MATTANSQALQLNPVLYRPKGNFDVLRVLSIGITLVAAYYIFLLNYQQSVFGSEIKTMAVQEKISELQIQHLKQHPKTKTAKPVKTTH